MVFKSYYAEIFYGLQSFSIEEETFKPGRQFISEISKKGNQANVEINFQEKLHRLKVSSYLSVHAQ